MTPRRTRPLNGKMRPMNAPLTRNQFTFSLGNLSYINPEYDDAFVPATKPETHGNLLTRCIAAVTEWNHRRLLMQEMAMMTDRELTDIGLSRSDITRVFDPLFAADHSRGRDYIAY